ncbi:hypothetical protein K474DRAFT_1075284 [Panus rudis PR-1116 ss-1]|nr:hypothetical protein K474DRAFT_1075284 [Panus rudis PR-1116 ss-1]
MSVLTYREVLPGAMQTSEDRNQCTRFGRTLKETHWHNCSPEPLCIREYPDIVLHMMVCILIVHHAPLMSKGFAST